MKRKSKRLASLVAASVILTGILGGCGQTQDNTASTSEQSTAITESGDSSEEQITLRFSWRGGDSRHEATLACIDAFEKQYPNIKIEAEYGGFDGYQDKISAALSGGTEADILQLDQPWMGTFMSQNPDFFLDVKEYSDVMDLDGFSQQFLDDFCVYNDKLVCLPTGTNAINFLANSEVLKEAGVEFGDVITWDDYYEQGKKVNAVNPDNYFLNMDNGTNYYVTRIYLMQLTNRQLINEDYTVGVTIDELEEALAYTKKLYDDKVVIPLEESMIFKGSPQDNPKWNNNQLGGWLNWSSQADQQQWGENAETLPYPCIEGTENSGLIVRPSQILAVSANCEHPKEAMMFLDFMFNQDDGILALKDCRSMPPTEHARELLTQNNMINEQASEAVELAMANPGTPEITVPNTTEVLDAFSAVCEKLVYGQYSSTREAAEDAYNQMTAMLENIKADLN